MLIVIMNIKLGKFVCLTSETLRRKPPLETEMKEFYDIKLCDKDSSLSVNQFL